MILSRGVLPSLVIVCPCNGDVMASSRMSAKLRHPIIGPIAFEYSAFAVDGRPDLGMVIYNPATPADAERIRSLIGSRWADGRQ